ncbi:hypothetical protein [Corynebacterium lubricantis]|uniref:hypothetical protein n=1 Tax=Corynebacterium lubricantis TaxID=541095 RepID=UPI00037A19B5|nr:hypothetical protein [Corynebacterium lubricantis]
MGRILLVILIIVAIWLLWRAFGPGSQKRLDAMSSPNQSPAIKGPDDDEEFLWNIEKTRFKERRAKEEADRRAKEEEERQRKFRKDEPGPDEQID